MSTKERIYFFDNLKTLLIVLVVFGHLLEYFLHINDIFKWSYIIIYSFHMPLFAFVSGFLSKNSNFKKFYPNILIQFLVFNFLYVIFICILFIYNPRLIEESLSQVNIAGGINPLLTILTPYWLMWYLLSLLFWRILLIFFKTKPVFLVGAIIIGIFFGYVNINGRILSLQRTFSLFPFFLAGYFIDYYRIKEFTQSRLSRLIFYVVIIILPVAYLYIDYIDVSIFYHSDSFKYLGFTNLQGAFIRTILYIVSCLMGAVFITFIPHKHTLYTDIGLKTINIYLLHGFIIQFFWAVGFFPLLYNLPIIFIFLILITLTVLIIYILSCTSIDIIMKKFFIKKKKRRN